LLWYLNHLTAHMRSIVLTASCCRQPWMIVLAQTYGCDN
jgi:hypothetical protein